MAARIHKLIAWTLFAVYGGIALLGHGGMHVLEGTHHVHLHEGTAVAAHSHSHAHGCCHHHHHSDSTGHDHSQPGEGDHHHHNGPAHDHDNCLICHHFAAKAALVTAAAPLSFSAGVEQVVCVPSAIASDADRYLLPIRGPPAGEC
jgi:hypothetical protein